jgi:hypothetical protein
MMEAMNLPLLGTVPLAPNAGRVVSASSSATSKASFGPEALLFSERSATVKRSWRLPGLIWKI